MQHDLSNRWIALLEQLTSEIGEHTANKDWMALGAIDQKIAKAIGELNRYPTLENDIKAAKENLKQAHATALAACANQCEELRIQLLRQLQYAEARSAYMHTEYFIKETD